LAKQTPPGYGNAMYVADPENVSRGPYSDSKGAMPHQTLKSEYHATSELCANCHNVSNPTLAQDVNRQPPHTFGHIERTYSEWVLSDFAKGPNPQTCQSCHYPRVPSGGQASRYGDLHRDYFVRHGPTGGSTWVQDAIYLIWKGKDLNREALEAGQQRAREFLKTAATMALNCSGGRARVTITNFTGHKLPTGYPEGRRMWLNVRFLDGRSNVLRELGRYGDKEVSVDNRQTLVPTLLDPEKTRVYECLPGISKEQGGKYNQP